MKRILVVLLLIMPCALTCCKKASSEAVQRGDVPSASEGGDEQALNELSALDLITSENIGVITGDDVNARSEALKSGYAAEKLFKGNIVRFIGIVDGDEVNGSVKWAKIELPYHYEELFVHSSFIKTGSEAEAYLKSFSYDEQYAKLKEDFSDAQIGSIRKYRNAYNSISTADDFLAVFRQAAALCEELSPVIEKKYERLREADQVATLSMSWIYNLLPGISINYFAEGTVANFSVVSSIFAQKALETKDKSDDTFISILIFCYGNEYISFYPTWFEYTWDYGGQSLLGEGIHYKALTMIDSALNKDRRFEKELTAVKDSILDDINKSIAYKQDAKTIQAEIDKIVTTIVLTEKQKTDLQKRKEVLQNPTPEIQINCKATECSFG